MDSVRSIRWWQWPNVLALDAALVAVGWQQWLSGGTGLAPGLVLGLSVWLTYTGDRWLDMRKLPWERIMTARHRFAKRWQKELLIIWLAVLVMTVAIAIAGLSRQQFGYGLALLLVCIAYTWLIQRRRRIPKETLVALIMTAGVVLFLGEKTANWGTMGALLGFFLLCFANCVLIAWRECDIDRVMVRDSLALRDRQAKAVADTCLLWVIGIGVVLLVFGYRSAAMLCVCALALYAIGKDGGRIGPERFRVLADGILLLPWLIVLLR